jgi:hypothetical protein
MMIMPRGSAHVYIRRDGEKHEKKRIHVASFFHRDITLDRNYRAFDQSYQIKQKRRFFIVYQFMGFSPLIGRRRGHRERARVRVNVLMDGDTHLGRSCSPRRGAILRFLRSVRPQSES